MIVTPRKVQQKISKRDKSRENSPKSLKIRLTVKTVFVVAGEPGPVGGRLRPNKRRNFALKSSVNSRKVVKVNLNAIKVEISRKSIAGSRPRWLLRPQLRENDQKMRAKELKNRERLQKSCEMDYSTESRDNLSRRFTPGLTC